MTFVRSGLTGRTEPDVSIIVVTYNSSSVIEDLLNSIPEGLGDLQAEVIVVDNGSVDSTRQILEGRADCRLIRSANVGYAGGINLGVSKASSAPAVLILNPDIRLEPNSVPPLIEAISDPLIQIATPRVHNSSGDLEQSLRRRPTILRALGLGRFGLPAISEYVTEPEAYETSHDVDWALGAAMLVSRRCFETLRGWDESYFLYSEETDFCLRAGDLGMRTRYVPSSQVMHIGGASGRTSATHSMQIVNRVRLYRRRNNAAKAWIYWGLTILSELSWLARGQSASRQSIKALVWPAARPPQLGCSSTVMPF